MNTFLGYPRPNGGAGVRNCVVVLPAIQCANELANRMAEQVEGAVPLLHNFSCGFLGLDQERCRRSVIGLGANPNVFAVLVVGLGCEPVRAEYFAAEINASGGNAAYVSVSEEKTYEEALEEGVAVLRTFVKEASLIKRVPCEVSKLTVAVRCGGSGAVSAISSNAATGSAADRLIDAGARVIFSETAELIGAEAILSKRASSEEIAQKLCGKIQDMLGKINSYGVDILGSEPSYGNIKQGLTTIEEKSMGAIAKTGTSPLVDVLEYAQAPTGGAGLYFMDGSSLSPILYTGMMAAGAQIQIHSYGGGLCARSRNLSTYPSSIPMYPVIKIMGSTHDDCAIPYFDVFAGDIVRGTRSIHDVGRELYDEVLAVASGKATFTEREITYREMLQFYADGLVM